MNDSKIDKLTQFKDYFGLPPETGEMAECYWCNVVKDKSKMKRSKSHNTTIYMCERCG